MIKANRKVMKKILVMFTMMMVAMVTFAKDIKTVVFTTTPQMHCAACENKIKSNLRFLRRVSRALRLLCQTRQSQYSIMPTRQPQRNSRKVLRSLAIRLAS